MAAQQRHDDLVDRRLCEQQGQVGDLTTTVRDLQSGFETINHSLTTITAQLVNISEVRENIQQVFDGRAIRELSSAKRRRTAANEPQAATIRNLPPTILVRIFECLFHSPIAEVYPPAVLAVCRSWRRLALSTQSLWTDPTIFVFDSACLRSNPEWDFIIPVRTIPVGDSEQIHALVQLLERCAHRAQHNVQSVAMWTEGHAGVERWLNVVRYSVPRLKSLTLFFDDADSLGESTPSAIEHEDQVDCLRKQLQDLINRSVTLRTLKIRLPDPTREAKSCVNWGLPSVRHRRLKTLVVLDPNFDPTRVFSAAAGEIDSAGIAYWSALACGVKICNVAALNDQDVIQAILLASSTTVEVLTVHAGIFEIFSRSVDFGASAFRHLKRLCLLHGYCEDPEDLHDQLRKLPCLEELEGGWVTMRGCAVAGLLGLTLWFDWKLRDLSWQDDLEQWLHKLHTVRHLTLIGAGKMLVDLVCRALSVPGTEKGAHSGDADDEGDGCNDLVCARLCTLTILVEGDPDLVDMYISPGTAYLGKILSDYKRQRYIQDRLMQLVQARNRYISRTHRRCEDDRIGDSAHQTVFLQRLTVRNYWCDQDKLWCLRVAFSSKMTELAVLTTVAPEGVPCHDANSTECLLDIVPKAPDLFRYTEWKRAMRSSLEWGLTSRVG